MAAVEMAAVEMAEKAKVLYAFEIERDERRSIEYAHERLPEFLKRLGCGDGANVGDLVKTLKGTADPNPQEIATVKGLIAKFIVNHHLAIGYYDRRRKKEQWFHWAFIGFSILLLVLVPFMPAFVPLLSDGVAGWFSGARVGDAPAAEDSASTPEIIAALTAALTALIAVHKTVAGWLDKRRLVGRFWQSAADLKNNLYTFEDEWKTKLEVARKDRGSNLLPEFLEDLKAANVAAKALMETERAEFFKDYAVPTLETTGLKDIFSLLSTSRTSASAMASSLVGDVVPPKTALAVQFEKDIAAKKAALAEINGKRAAFAGLIKARREEAKALTGDALANAQKGIAALEAESKAMDDTFVIEAGALSKLEEQRKQA